MEERDFMPMLWAQWKAGKFVSVGLDSEFEKIPEIISSAHSSIAETLFYFNARIIDATCDLACLFKVNSAFYEVHGVSGIKALIETIEYITTRAPLVPIILDAKRADIGNTNNNYAKFAFEACRADAITVNPYFGGQSLEPFLGSKNKGIFVLCRTSNPGAEEFQSRLVRVSEDEFKKFNEILSYESGPLVPLYQLVALRVTTEWNKNGNCGLVIGATAPSELWAVRKISGDVPILIPGVGAQGGDLETAIKSARSKDGKLNAIINSSRGIIFASKGDYFADAARRETEKLTNEINRILSEKEEVKQ